MHLFVAVVPPEEAVEHLDSFLDVRRAHVDLRWSRAADLHVTLAYADEVSQRRLDDLLPALADAAARRGPVAGRVAGGGAFPHPAAARVLWAGLEQPAPAAQELQGLSRGVRTAAARAGVRVDARRLHPHVTVARCRAPRPLDDWVRLLEGYAGPAWSVSHVQVFGSVPGPGYEVVAELPLGSPGPADPTVPAGHPAPPS